MSESAHHTNYVKIWAILLGLLIVSVLGPMVGIKIITLITAFGVAVVKATMVCGYFMHLNIERRMIWYLLFVSLGLVAVCFFGTSSDIMQPSGTNWVNCRDTGNCIPTIR